MKALAPLFLRLAQWLLRGQHAEWGRAMRAELSYLSNEQQRLHWAFGCLVAAIKQRIAPMDTGTFRISRWVMLIETLACFAPLTIGCLDLNFGQSGIIRHSPEIIERFYLAVPGGAFLVSMLFAGAVVSLLGPIGLFLGLRYVLIGRGIRKGAVGLTLIGIPIALGVLGTIAGFLVGPEDFKVSFEATLLLVILPVVGFAHLMYLTKPEAPALAADALA
jgi:hypothetical protein